MSLDAGLLLNKIADRARTLGCFERVHTHEPRSAPGSGTTLAVWSDGVASIRSSGLTSVSVSLPFNARIYVPGNTEDQDRIDPTLLSATSAVYAALAGGFELDGEVRAVDLLGMDGQPMAGQAGYLEMDTKEYRVMSLRFSVICNDAWEVAP